MRFIDILVLDTNDEYPLCEHQFGGWVLVYRANDIERIRREYKALLKKHGRSNVMLQ